MTPLDIQKLPLTEKVLIEASAGTGKTYTIGLIVLRLLLEKNLPIEKIVLITFTEAATLELRKKTAEKIREYVANPDKELNSTEKAKLFETIARIDEMPVFTIHGFCRRLLSEFAFETGNFEEREISTDQSELENRIVADFWRREIEKLSEEEIACLPEKFSPDIIKTGLKNILNFPDAKIEFEENDKTVKSGEKLIAKLQHKLAKEFLETLHREKEKLKIMGFNDLIENAYKAVKEDKEKILFYAVQKKYDAILVDEFQDTDKMQFYIFSTLFSGKPFFMIGDPKQAIYRFRGGDIYAYLDAKQKCEEKYQYTLKKNYRSQKRLLSALNKIFKTNDNPFVNKDIEYEEVEAGKDLQELTINGERQKPLVIRNIKYKNKGELNTIRYEIVQEIRRLLYETNTEISARDIAILTRTNSEAKKYRDALKKSTKKIPAVIRRSDSVFKSEAADYMMRLLTAFIHSQKENRVRAALMDMRELSVQDIKPFADAFKLWKKNGIMRAINSFFDSNQLWGAMRVANNGERNITNLRQLIEILNEEEIVYGRVPERMLRRFAELIKNSDNEEIEEKLETDDDAVQIMTIHTSKGLQFPIVFVPDIMLVGDVPGKSIYERDPPVYHRGQDIIIEYEISNRKAEQDNAKSKEKKELLEESARNFYVAVTRPIYRLYIVNAYKEKQEKSAGQKICSNILEDENIKILEEKLESIEYPNNPVKKQESENEELEKLPKVKDFIIEPAWQRTSFTAISKNLKPEDYAYELPEAKIKMPAGARMGTILHSLFENVDFKSSKAQIQEFVENKLSGLNAFSEGSKKEIANWIDIILKKDLGDAGELCKIDANNKAAELDFFMKTGQINLEKIKEIMGEKIDFATTENLLAKYLKGIIDLVFLAPNGKYYILDWKSTSLNNYSQAEMSDAMQRAGYHLQYYIYAVALKRWLEATHKDFSFKEQFGGVYYIFIRGVNEGNDDGVFYVPCCDMVDGIEGLDKSLS